MDESERTLRERFRRGDEGAFRALVERYTDGLRARLSARIPERLRRRVSSSDVLQETCILAFARREDFEDRGEGSFGAWLDAIAERKLNEEIRRHAGTAKRAAHREVPRGRRPDTSAFVGRQRSPSSIVQRGEDLERVREAMSRLSEDHRTVLRLALERGLPLREVAVQMGRSREAAKKLYGRAVVRLRALLDGAGDDA